MRNLTVIGEAASRVPEAVQTANPGVPWKLMGRMRNVVIHEYFGVDAALLRGVIQHDLPSIIAPLEIILESTREP